MIRVLVADDDGVSRYLLTNLLGRWGFETVAAADGAEALEIMGAADPPRLLLLDLEMPKVDGLEVCRSLRRVESLNPPYIIFLTAHRDSGQMLRIFEAGASGYISKRCNWEELRARVRVGERTLRLQDQLHAARGEMQELAMRDVLTGLYNRRPDLVGRWGGDEFLFLILGQERENIGPFFERIRLLAAGLRVPVEGGEVGITTSIGVAVAGEDETA